MNLSKSMPSSSGAFAMLRFSDFTDNDNGPPS